MCGLLSMQHVYLQVYCKKSSKIFKCSNGIVKNFQINTKKIFMLVNAYLTSFYSKKDIHETYTLFTMTEIDWLFIAK